jgi:hypothetical protein
MPDPHHCLDGGADSERLHRVKFFLCGQIVAVETVAAKSAEEAEVEARKRLAVDVVSGKFIDAAVEVGPNA